jgi:type III restriction enzyme
MKPTLNDYRAEIENETGIRFGIIEKDAFAHLIFSDSSQVVGIAGSHEIWSELQTEGYLEKSGKITKALKEVFSKTLLLLARSCLTSGTN